MCRTIHRVTTHKRSAYEQVKCGSLQVKLLTKLLHNSLYVGMVANNATITMRVNYEKGVPNVLFSITYLHTSSTYASKHIISIGIKKL